MESQVSSTPVGVVTPGSAFPRKKPQISAWQGVLIRGETSMVVDSCEDLCQTSLCSLGKLGTF